MRLEENYNYEVNNIGEVRNIKTGKILKPQTISDGYYAVYIKVNGKTKWLYIHRLVGKAFLKQNEELINHKDGDIRNNVVWINPDGSVDYEKSNLEWCNHSYNVIDGIIRRMGLNISVSEYQSKVGDTEYMREYMREYYKKNKDHYKDYYQKNREKILAAYREKKANSHYLSIE